MIKKILYVVRDDGGCGFYRCQQPAAFLKRAGLAETEVIMREATRDQLLSADLVIMQEMGSSSAAEIVQFCLQNKIPYVAEIDDYLHHISPHNFSGYPAWNPSTLYLYRAMELVRSSIGVTVSTNQLAREYFPYNPAIYVVPNYLDKEKWINPIVKRNDNKIRIGWAGGNAHADDLKMISLILEKIVKEFKGKIIFETMGMTKKELEGVFPMKDFPEICPVCGYEGELRHWPGEGLNDYPLILASKGWDLALAPVINNAFGNCKSDIKIKEYAAVGVPIIASPIVPYKEAAENNAQILFANTFEEWYTQIKGLIKNPKKRDDMARKNKEWVSQYWIEDNIGKIFEVYFQIISKAELVFGKRSIIK